MKLAGATTAAAGLVRWAPRAMAQSTPATPAAFSLAPTIPVAVDINDGAPGIQALLAYDPTQDPDARYLRSLVPLAPRIPAFQATQAQPRLSPLPQNNNEDFPYELYQGYVAPREPWFRYGNATNVAVGRFLQYQDIVSSISDQFLQGYAPTLAKFTPSAAHIDAAHRNGVPVIGWLASPNMKDPKYYFTMQNSDGSYPVGDKLVDIAAYFGFDGYFFNLESDLRGPEIQAIAIAMKKRAKAKGMKMFYQQYYDNGAALYPGGSDDPIISGAFDSYMPDYYWPNNFQSNGPIYPPTSEPAPNSGTQLQVSLATMKADKRNPFQTIFYGLDIQEQLDNSGHANALDTYAPEVIPPDGVGVGGNNAGPGVASIALFLPISDEIKTANNMVGANATDAQLAKAFLTAQRKFWTSSTQNPALSPAPPDPASDTTVSTYDAKYGVANFITERSTIGSLPFLTRFNMGSGSLLFNQGKAVSQNPWYSLGIQDILPTWEWWTKDFNSSAIPAGLLSADYDFTTAYNGGSSLKISGKLGPKNPTELRLFKTKLLVSSGGDPYVGLRYKAGQSGASNLYLGLIFEDNPSATVWTGVDAGFNIGAKTNGWTQAKLPLGNYAGRTIAAISLGFKVGGAITAASSYAINIGEVALSNAASDAVTMAVPTGFAIEKSQIIDETSAQLRLTWNFDPAVWYYDIYRQPLPNGNETLATLQDPTRMIWLGRITGDCYYVNNLPRLSTASQTELITGIQLVAVSPAGKETVAYYRGCIPFSWTTNRGTPSFSLLTSVPNPNFATGTSTTVPIAITELNGFNSPVTLKASGLPAGLTAVFSPNPATGTSAVLTLAASKTVVAGTYTVTVTGTSGSMTSTVTLAVSVGSPSFSLSDSKGGYMFLSGTTGVDLITVTSMYGFNSSVALSVSGLPPGMTASFSPASTKGSSTLTLTTNSAYTNPGGAITITGTSGPLTQVFSLYIY